MKWQKLSLIVSGAVIGLIVVEFLFRMAPPLTIKEWIKSLAGERRNACLVKDEKLHHKFLANCEGIMKNQDFEVRLKTNSLGLREREIGDKQEGIYRVLILGDSYAQGWGVERDKRFSELMSQKLGQGVEIVNAGVNSYSPILEFEYLKSQGVEFKPDMVVVILDFSDFHDDYFYGGWQRHDQLRQELLPGSKELVKERIDKQRSGLLKQLTLIDYLLNKFKGLWLSKQQVLGWENLMTDVLIYEKGMEWEGYEKAWNLSVANLGLMKEYLESQGIAMAVGIAPKGLFYEGAWEVWRQMVGFKSKVAYDWWPIRMIEAKLMQQGIEVVSWHEAFLEGEAKELFFDYDGHWTEAGHEIIAKELETWLAAKANKF